MKFSSGLDFSELSFGLTRLSFSDNFECAVKEVTLGTGGETRIPNPLKGIDKIPKYYIPIKKDKAGDVFHGSTAWTNDFIYLNTDAASDLTVTIAFFGEL